MGRFGIPQSSSAQGEAPPPINWRRGLLRVWMVLSAGWIMSWLILVGLEVLRGETISRNHVADITLVLLGPPVALLLFGLGTGWAFRGFVVGEARRP